MKKANMFIKGMEMAKAITKDVATYDAAVKEAQNKFWAKHPVCKKIATVAAVALVVANVALSLDEAGTFDVVKEKMKKKKIKELKEKTTPASKANNELLNNNNIPIFKEDEIIEL